jgi:Fe-S-cluster containining protein
MSKEQIAAELLVQEESGEGHSFRVLPCSLLKENLCSAYPHRPADCRSFPHIQKKDFVSRLNQAFSNCSVCPIVFNVFELLKLDLWRERKSNYEWALE